MRLSKLSKRKAVGHIMTDQGIARLIVDLSRLYLN